MFLPVMSETLLILCSLLLQYFFVRNGRFTIDLTDHFKWG